MLEATDFACAHGFLTLQERSGQLRWVRADGEPTGEPVIDASLLAYFGYDLSLWAEECRHCCTSIKIALGDPSRKGVVGVLERAQARPDAVEYRYLLSGPGHPPTYVPRDGEQADSFEEEQAQVIWLMLESLASTTPA